MVLKLNKGEGITLFLVLCACILCFLAGMNVNTVTIKAEAYNTCIEVCDCPEEEHDLTT